MGHYDTLSALKQALCTGRPETWQAVCSVGDEDDRAAKMEQYANYLDTVETHLLQEIAARSSNFFEAAGIVQDLRAALTRTFQQVAGLRRQVKKQNLYQNISVKLTLVLQLYLEFAHEK